MARINAKPPLNVDPAATYLEQLSKAALIDIICDAIPRDKGEEHAVLRESDAKAFSQPVLRLREDKIPDSTEDMLEKAKRKSAARRLFRGAQRIAGAT